MAKQFHTDSFHFNADSATRRGGISSAPPLVTTTEYIDRYTFFFKKPGEAAKGFATDDEGNRIGYTVRMTNDQKWPEGLLPNPIAYPGQRLKTEAPNPCPTYAEVTGRTKERKSVVGAKIGTPSAPGQINRGSSAQGFGNN